MIASGPYAILDVGAHLSAERAPETLERFAAAGIRTFQLRAKALDAGPFLELARACRVRAQAAGVTFIVNDRPDIAALAGADGVHLGQHDLAIVDVRAWLPAHMTIGVSCHSLDQVDIACVAGADHLGYGPVFNTPTKQNPDPVVGVDGLAAACARAGDRAVIAIGGIGLDDLPTIRGAGARAAAMIGALLGAADPTAAARAAVEAWR